MQASFVLLKRLGFQVGVITGGDSLSIEKRFQDNIALDFVYKGKEDKRGAFQDLISKGFKADEILYMGDELFDIPLLKVAGFSATVPCASADVLGVVDYVTEKSAGNGAVREVIDILFFSRDLKVKLPELEL